MKRKYKRRYLVELWDKPAKNTGERIIPGIRESKDNYGYSDELFIASILTKDNAVESVAFFSTEKTLSRAMLEMVKKQIEHHLEHHAPPD